MARPRALIACAIRLDHRMGATGSSRHIDLLGRKIALCFRR